VGGIHCALRKLPRLPRLVVRSLGNGQFCRFMIRGEFAVVGNVGEPGFHLVG